MDPFQIDDDETESPFEDGEWKWDELKNELVFISHRLPEDLYSTLPSVQNLIGPVIFKDDLDLLEQEKFHIRYHRKTALGKPDVITLQDIKDVVFYTAPIAIITKEVIDVMHIPIMERFLRALILYCKYYLQVSDEMERRRKEGENKIRTANSDAVETELRDNLATLRLLIAKEYCPMLIDTTVNQLLKSTMFYPTKGNAKFKQNTREESSVLSGEAKIKRAKKNTRSHLLEEILSKSRKDYRMYGLATIHYPRLTPRLMYLEQAISAPEEKLSELGVSLGIIGLPRKRFTVMLQEIKKSESTTTSQSNLPPDRIRSRSRSSRVSARKSSDTMELSLFPDIVLPKVSIENGEDDPLEAFPKKLKPEHVCNRAQYQKWLNRLNRVKSKTKHEKK